MSGGGRGFVGKVGRRLGVHTGPRRFRLATLLGLAVVGSLFQALPAQLAPNLTSSTPATSNLTRYYNGTYHQTSTAGLGGSWAWEKSLGLVYQTSGTGLPSGVQTLYECSYGSGTQFFTSLSATCEGVSGWSLVATLGKDYSTQPTGMNTIAIYRCLTLNGLDHFDSLDPSCEKQHFDVFLGYTIAQASLDRYANSGATEHWTGTEGVGSTSFSFDVPLGVLYLTQLNGTVPIYECVKTAQADYMTSLSTTCDGASGYTLLTTLGYLYSSQPNTGPTMQIYRCHMASGTHFDTRSSTCEGNGTQDNSLGWTIEESSLTRYWNGGSYHVSTTTGPPSGFNDELPLGMLYINSDVSGTVALYMCLNGASDYFTSTASNCEGKTVEGTDGYIYSSAPSAPYVTLYRCLTSPNNYHYDSNASNCEGGGTNELTLGYALTAGLAPPGSPASVSATVANGSASVSWTAPTITNGNPISGYGITPILLTTNSSGAQVLTNLETMTVSTTASPFTVPNLVNGQAYAFSVVAINAAGASTPTTTTGCGTTCTAYVPGLPGAPTAVSAHLTSLGSTYSAAVSWTPPSSLGASALTGFTVTPYVGSTAKTPTSFWNSLAGINVTSGTVNGLATGSNYTFKVSALNTFGAGPQSSASGTAAAVVPGVPINVTVTPGNAQATVSWAAPVANGGASVDNYTVTTYIGGTSHGTTTTSSTSKTVTGLTNGTTYTFTVKAHNSAGWGSESPNSWNVLPANPAITTSVAVSTTAGTGSAYQQGGSATFTATVSTSSSTNVTESYTDTLPNGVNALGSLIQVGGAACSGGVSCSSTASTVTVTGLTVKSSTPVTITYTVVLAGTGAAPASVTDNGVATISSGNSGSGNSSFTINDAGLGAAPWWSFTKQALGDGGAAQVNVANGNLVVTAGDATPMQLHGGLKFDLQRTYNSEQPDSLGQQTLFGPGWSYSFVDAGSELAGDYLAIPSSESYANPGPVTVVDGSGARFTFTPPTTTLTPVSVGGTVTGPLGTLHPVALTAGGGYSAVCADRSFIAPAGIHEALIRYIETSGSDCTTLSSSTTQVLGFVTIGADRVRREFNASGQLLNIRDAAGNEVDYTYTSNLLTQVQETGSLRKFQISYGTGNVPTITDPGGEVTTYTFTSGRLTGVLNPSAWGGTTLAYVYGGCTNSAAYQLCTATDSRSNSTTFTYNTATIPTVHTWVDRVGNTSTLAYSAGTTTVIRSDANGQKLNEETQYTSIDGSGRVYEIDQGNTTPTWLDVTIHLWDSSGQTCRPQDSVADNNTCAIVRRSASGAVSDAGDADRVTYYTYSVEGRILIQEDINAGANEYVTAGYAAEYFESTSACSGHPVCTFTDTPGASGTVTSTPGSGTRRDAQTLFYIADQTASIGACGNAAATGSACQAGSTYDKYETTYNVDNVNTATINTSTSPICSGGSTTANTGVVCQATQPHYASTGGATTTQYTYNSDGTRATMKTPLAYANSSSATYQFTYYANSAKDLGNTTSAGGWLADITDPSTNCTGGCFAAFAYDAEGHAVRTWGRTATATSGLATTSFPGTPASPPTYSSTVVPFTETLYTNTATDNATTDFSAPGRYAVATRDATGASWAWQQLDNNGNVTTSCAPNGTGDSPVVPGTNPCQDSGSQTHATTDTYDKNDNKTATTRPMEQSGSHSSNYTYDAFNNLVKSVDPLGHATSIAYDEMNRKIATITQRGQTLTTGVPDYVPSGTPPGANCYPVGGSTVPKYNTVKLDTWMPANSMNCITQTYYDGVDNPIQGTDGNGSNAFTLYDAIHHALSAIAPPNNTTGNSEVTTTLYDAGGNTTDVCAPDEMAQDTVGPFVCNGSAPFASHTTYDVMGRKASTITYRTQGTADTATYTYDADGNVVTSVAPNGNAAGCSCASSWTTSTTFDALDRKLTVTVSSSTATYSYYPGGEMVYQQTGSGLHAPTTDYSYDADGRVLDTVTGASSTTLASTTTYNASNGTDVRTRKVYDADGNVTTVYAPNAFTSSVSSPNVDYMSVRQYSADDEAAATYQARYDSTSGSPLNEQGSSTAEENQCPINNATNGQSLSALGYNYNYNSGHPYGTGVCTTVDSYDYAGNKTQENGPTWTNADQNPHVGYNYFDDNLLASTTIPNPTNSGRVANATNVYDGDGKLTSSTDADSIATTTAYFANESVQTVTKSPNAGITHVTSYAYDPSGQHTSTTDAMGVSSSTLYLPNGLKASSIDGSGDITSYTYDASGNTTQVKSPSANAADANNPQGIPTYDVYTGNNLLLYTVTPTGVPTSGTYSQRATCYSYDTSGRKTGEYNTPTTNYTSASGSPCGGSTSSFAFSYFPDDRLNSETGTNGSDTENYIYDANGNQTSMLAPSGTTTATYYADDLPQTVLDSTGGRKTEYDYDGAGNVTRDTNVPGGGATYFTTYTYSDAELPNTEVGWIGSNDSWSWNYDAAGKVTQQADGNGAVENWSYRTDGTLSTKTITEGTTNISTFDPSYDGDYRVTSAGCDPCLAPNGTAVADQWNYQYDRAGRMDGTQQLPVSNAWQFETYDHDGNRTSFADLTSGSTTTYTYNADDSLASTTQGTTVLNSTYTTDGVLHQDGCQQWSQDFFDQMIGVSAQTGRPAACGATQTASYTHDALGRENSTTVGSTTTTIHDDGLTSHTVVSNNGTTDTAYQLAPSGTPLLVTNGTNTEDLSTDSQGNIATTISGAGANDPQCQVLYDPYGNSVFPQSTSNPCLNATSGSTLTTALYRAEQRDTTTNTYQPGSRVYDPAKNSFDSQDGYVQGSPSQDLGLQTDPMTRNQYGYVDGNPVNLMDPSGHDPCGDCHGQTCSPGDECGGGGCGPAPPGQQQNPNCTGTGTSSTEPPPSGGGESTPPPQPNSPAVPTLNAPTPPLVSTQTFYRWCDTPHFHLIDDCSEGSYFDGQNFDQSSQACLAHQVQCDVSYQYTVITINLGGHEVQLCTGCDSYQSWSDNRPDWTGVFISLGPGGELMGSGLSDSAALKQIEALKASSGADVAARLDIGGDTYLGTNLARTNPPLAGSVDFFVEHAEGDALSQAVRSGDYSGQSGVMWVTRDPCAFCKSGLSGVAQRMGLRSLVVLTPDGLYGAYTPETGWVTAPKG